MGAKGTPEIRPQEAVDVFNLAELGMARSAQRDLDPSTSGIQANLSEVRPSHLTEVRRHIDEFNRGMTVGQAYLLRGLTPNAEEAVTQVDRASHQTAKAYTTVLRGASEYYTTNHPSADPDRKANEISEGAINRGASYIKHLWGERADVLYARKPDLEKKFSAGKRIESNLTLAA